MIARWIAACAVCLWAASAQAQSVAELNTQAIDAFQAQDYPRAMELTLKAIETGLSDPSFRCQRKRYHHLGWHRR